VDPNGQAATWLKNNPLDGLYYGLMGLSFVPGLNIVASIGMMAIDLAKGDYTSLAMDSLGILLPGAAVGLKLSYDGVKAVVDGLRVGEKFGGFGIRVGARVAVVANCARAIKSAVGLAIAPSRSFGSAIKSFGVKAALAPLKVGDVLTSKKIVSVTPDGFKMTSFEKGNVAPDLKDSLESVVKKNKPYADPKRRPKYGKDQVKTVWENAQNVYSDGIVRDPNTLEELTWDKTRSRAGQWDMGHIKDHEYRRLHSDYMAERISKAEFLEEYRNPNNYLPESVHSNRSHKYEAK